MKRNGIIVLLIVALQILKSNGQELKDRIFLKTGDSVICNITEIKGEWVYYDYLKKNVIKKSHDHLTDISYYVYNNKPVFPDSYTPKTYLEIVSVDSTITKNELYSTFLDWFAKNYVSAQNVIQYQDKEEGKIVGRGTFKVYIRNGFGDLFEAGYVHYTMSLFVKHGRYKYQIDNIYHDGNLKVPSGGNLGRKKPIGSLFLSQWVDIQKESDIHFKDIIKSMKNSANNSKKSADW